MTEAERIARSLTEAQKRAVASASWSEGRGAWHQPGYYCAADKRVRYRLCRAGLLVDYLRRSNRLTDAGCKVREVLQRETGHE